VLQGYLRFWTVAKAFSNWVTSGVSPAWSPSRPIRARGKCPSYTAMSFFEGSEGDADESQG
jgi:hypothetical protein